MTERAIAKAVVLSKGTTVKIKLSSGTQDFAQLQKIIDDTVAFVPIGGDPLLLEALDGVDFEVSQKIGGWKITFPYWANGNDITVLQAAMGAPVVTGTNPFVNTFTGGTIGQDVDFVATGLEYGSTTKYNQVNGSSGSLKITNLDIVKGQNWKYKVELTFGADNCSFQVGSATDLRFA